MDKISLTNGAMERSPLGDITFTTALFDFISPDLKGISRGLLDADGFQFRPVSSEHRAPVSFESPADLHSEIFRGWNRPAENLDLEVEVAMLHRLEYLPSHQLIQNRQIHSPPRMRFQGPACAHLDHVIVTMTIGLRAFPVQAPVGLLADERRIEPMRSGELVAAGHAKHITLPGNPRTDPVSHTNGPGAVCGPAGSAAVPAATRCRARHFPPWGSPGQTAALRSLGSDGQRAQPQYAPALPSALSGPGPCRSPGPAGLPHSLQAHSYDHVHADWRPYRTVSGSPRRRAPDCGRCGKLKTRPCG